MIAVAADAIAHEVEPVRQNRRARIAAADVLTYPNPMGLPPS